MNFKMAGKPSPYLQMFYMKHFLGLLKSRTFWFNFASILLEISGYLTSVVPPGTALIAINIANILLRSLTTKSLNDK